MSWPGELLAKAAISAVVYLVFRVAHFSDPPLAAATLAFLLLIAPAGPGGSSDG